MSHRQIILQELKEWAPVLAERDISHPFIVPEGYFGELPSTLLTRIKVSATDDTPVETGALSPLLEGIGRRMPFTTPEGYFDRFAEEMTAAGAGRRKGTGLYIRRSFFRYAAAAAVAALLFTAGWFYINRSSSSEENGLALGEAGQMRILGQVADLSDDEITAFLETSAVLPGYDTLAIQPQLQEEDIKLMLAGISDQELENYLEETGLIKEQFN